MIDNKKEQLIACVMDLFKEAEDIGISVDALIEEIRIRLEKGDMA